MNSLKYIILIVFFLIIDWTNQKIFLAIHNIYAALLTYHKFISSQITLDFVTTIMIKSLLKMQIIEILAEEYTQIKHI